MGLFDIEHKDIDIKKNYNMKVERKEVPPIEEEIEEKPSVDIDSQKKVIDDLIEKNTDLSNIMKNNQVAKKLENVNGYFDKNFIDQLEILHSHLKQFMPGLPPYYKKETDGSYTVSYQSYLDAKDYVLNEFGTSSENLIYEVDENGNVYSDRMYFSGGYSVTKNGNIYHSGEPVDTDGKGKKNKSYTEDLIFNANDSSKIYVDNIDFKDEIITFVPGVRVKIDKIGNVKKWKKYFIDDNQYLDDKDKEELKKGSIKFDKVINHTEDYEDMSPSFKKEMDNYDGLKLSDLEYIFGRADMTEPIKKVITNEQNFPDGFQYCSVHSTNFIWLLFLMIIGGGEAGKKPLPQDKTICGFYEKPKRKGLGFVGKGPSGGPCGPKKYQTGHDKTYSKENSNGVKISLLQILYKFLEPIYEVNINSLEFEVSGAKIKLTPAICIGGVLEHAICTIQEWMSKEIRDSSGCDSQYIMPVLSDEGEGLHFAGFENITEDGKNENDITMFFRRNFAILYNYTHYHSKFDNLTETERENKMIDEYNTLSMRAYRSLAPGEINKLCADKIHITYSDIEIDIDTGLPSTTGVNSHSMGIDSFSTVGDYSENVVPEDEKKDPSNVNKILFEGLYASHNCDAISKLDLYQADYSDSEFKPILNN